SPRPSSRLPAPARSATARCSSSTCCTRCGSAPVSWTGMRCSRWLAALIAAVALTGASAAQDPGGPLLQPPLLQPMGPGYDGCGCSVQARDLEPGRAQSQLLFQDLGLAPATTVRIDGAHQRLQPLSGELFVEWGAPVGTPVAASFAMP